LAIFRFSTPAAALVAAMLAASAPSHATPDAGDAGRSNASDDAARRAVVAVRVGSRVVSVGELEDRLAELPAFQVETYGGNHDEIVRAYVDQVLVRDLVLGAGAELRKLDATFPTRSQILRAKSTAALRALRGSFKSPAAIPMDEVTKYYEANRTHFEGPERINLWRILCKSRDEAASVITDAKRELTIPNFNNLAREHSIDKATNFRGGNLGFVAPDGSSNEAGLKVDPALLAGVRSVGDGALAPEPVAESGGFAVVWRRTTVPATRRSLEDATAQIRTTLFRERTEAAEKNLIEELRRKNVRDVNADLLKIIEFPAVDAGFSLPRSVPSLAPRSDAAR
jgi:peptidyl-prolyl cis-trans isomerase C